MKTSSLPGQSRAARHLVAAISLFTVVVLVPAAPAALVAYYNFNEGSGTAVNDSSGNANHGALGASAGFSSDSPFIGGTSMDSTLNTLASGTAIVPNSSTLQGITDNLTISMWVKAAAGDQPNWVRMLRKGNESNPINDNSTWMLNRLSNTNRVVTRLDTSGTGGSFNQNRPGTGGSDGLTALTGQWEHMVFIYEGTQGGAGTVTGLLNGIQVFSASYNHGNGLSNTQPLIIGGRNDQSTNGLFDDLGIFDSSLTVGEARAIYNLAADFHGNYDLGKVNQLITQHAQGGGSVVVDGLRWDFIDNLPGNPGDFYSLNGLLVQQLGQTSGMAVPEPGRALLLMMAGLALAARRRRS